MLKIEIILAVENIEKTSLTIFCIIEQLGWSKATTYTVLRSLAERGVLKNENATVSSLVSKEDVQTSELENMVERTLNETNSKNP